MKKGLFFLMVLLSQQLLGQYFITGNVQDAESLKPLTAVQISVDGGASGGITDSLGNFNIKVANRKGILRFYYVGYNQKKTGFKIKETEQNLGKILLNPHTYSLEEVTVSAGLADETKDPVSVSNISAKTIKNRLGDRTLPI